MNEPTQRVVTESGQEHALGMLLGIGGQGAVYAVQGQPRAIKILQTRSPYDRERLRGQITFVQGRPLDGLPLARPLEMLQAPLVGYVMELLTEMEPLDRLMRPPRDVPGTNWYIETGGLRRRLRLLARCAEALAQLHGIPLVYMDLSPWNVFVSRHAESSEVWLIDTDNLQCITSPLESVFGTRPYVAPELSRGYTGANSLTDAYSFAVLAFETLAQTHPFEGELGARLDPEALQSQIDRGGLPWVFHPEDHRNSLVQGIDDPALVLTRALTGAFQKSFGPGLKDSTVRPGMAVWADLLHAAADLTVQCSGCGGTYYPRSGRCPWCDHPRPAFALANVRRWEPEAAREEERLGGKQTPFAQVAVTAGETVALTDRITRAMSGSGSHGRCLELTLRQGALEVRGVDGRQYQLTETHTGRQNRVGGGRKIPSEAPEGTVLLHFGPLDKPHRLATFKFYQEAQA